MTDLIKFIGSIVWGPHMLIFLLGIGIYFTIRLNFVQVIGFPEALKFLFSNSRSSIRKQEGKGDLTSYEALMTSLGGVVGNGNIAGVATAIAVGGPGAIFWMWISALFGMANSFAESSLGVFYRRVNQDGSILAGPMYYIKYGLGWGWLAAIFALFMGLKTLITTTTIQVNSMTLVVNKLLGIPMLLGGIGIAILIWLVIIKGISGIASVATKLTPFMVITYLGVGIIIVLLNISEIPSLLALIVNSAFTPQSATGGFAGASVMMAMRYGVARGAFSNEAGAGSAPVVHGAAKVSSPRSQGRVSMIGVFIDTIFINTLTALVILSAALWTTGNTSTVLAASSFEFAIGSIGAWVVGAASLLFGFSTLIAWPYYGEQCFAYLFGNKIRLPFRWIFCFILLAGTVKEVEAIWILADVMNGMMVIPNLIALVALGGVVVKLASGNEKHEGTAIINHHKNRK